MKTKEELNALKEEVETLNQKLAELTDEELAQVSGGGKFLRPDFLVLPVIESPVLGATVSPFKGNTSLTERPDL